MDELFIATSYAPGHNFWSGDPFSWWVRGILGFALVAMPQIVALMLVVRWCRRKRAWTTFAMGVSACAAMYVIWPHSIGLRFSDGDMPWYIGLRWGDSARLWLLASTVVGAGGAVAFQRRERPGFPVILAQGPTVPRESARLDS